jgi:hypothetical protein
VGWSKGHSRESGFGKIKNSTNEASTLVKTLKGCWNEAKKCLETKELYGNIGSKAKKWLIKKHITLLGGANYARSAHQLAQFRA